MKKEILKMTKDDLLALNPYDFALRPLSTGGVIHIAEALGAFWRYDYQAAEAGRSGKHAILKSGLHSDGFLISKILLEPENIRLIMALQLGLRFGQRATELPNYLVGIPDGATELAKDLGQLLDIRVAEMNKSDGRITVTTRFYAGDKLLIIEDFCTKGTGFKETVLEIKGKYPEVKISPYELVIVNRGGLKEIVVEGIGAFTIISIADYQIKEWDPDPEKCELCRDYGSVAIKPKVSEESWLDITTSQRLPVNLGRDSVDQFLTKRFSDGMNS